MGKIYDRLAQDYRIKEGLKACISCGTCTAICPAAEFYRYNPKKIVTIVQSRDDEAIIELLKGDQIWYCGECLSCVTRCPRKNAPGLVIMALRSLSIELGYFAESEKGRQMLPLMHAMQRNVLNYGYCVYPKTFAYDKHPGRPAQDSAGIARRTEGHLRPDRCHPLDGDRRRKIAGKSPGDGPYDGRIRGTGLQPDLFLPPQQRRLTP